jgi:hypothetical protein
MTTHMKAKLIFIGMKYPNNKPKLFQNGKLDIGGAGK